MSESNTNAPATPSGEPVTRRKRRWPWVVGGLLLVLIALVAFAPTIVSSVGKGSVESAINGTIKGSVKIDGLSLSWLGGQEIRGLTLHDPDGERVLSAKTISTELSLWNALMGDMNLGDTIIAGVDGDVKIDAEGVSNLQKAIEMVEPSPETDEPTTVPKTLALNAQVRDARIKVTPHGGQAAELTDLEATAVIPSVTEALTLKLTGKTKRGNESGTIALDGSVEDLFDADGVLTPERAGGKLTADITNVPTALIEGVAPLRGVADAAIGGRIESAKVDAAVTPETQRVAFSIKSPRLNGAQTMELAGGRVRSTGGEPITLLATPELLAALGRLAETEPPVALVEPTTLTLTLAALDAPAKEFDLADLALNVKLTAEPMQFAGAEAVGRFTIRGLSASVDTPRLGDSAKFALSADVVSEGAAPGKIAVDGSATDLFKKDGAFNRDGMVANATASITGVQAAVLNRLVPIELPATEEDASPQKFDFAWLGTVLNATAQIQTQGDTRTANVTVDTDKLKANLPLAIGERIETTAPGSLAWQMPRAVVQALGLADTISVDPVTTIQVADIRLSAPVPAEGEPAFAPEKTMVNAVLTVSSVAYAVDEASHVSLANLKATLSGESLAAADVRITTAAILANGSDRLSRFAGRKADIALNATLALAAEGPVTADPVKLTIKSDQLALDVTARLGAETIALIEPAKLNYTLTQELLTQLEAWPAEYPPLAGPTPITLTIDELRVPRTDFDVAKVALKATAALTPAEGNDPLRELFGSPAEVKAVLAPADGGSTVNVAVASERVKANLPGKLTLGEDGALLLAQGAGGTITATPRLVRMLKLVEEGGTTITEPVTVKLTLAQTRVPTAGFALDKLKTQVSAEIDRIALAGGQVEGAAVTNLRTTEPLTFDGPGGVLSVRLAGDAAKIGKDDPPSPIGADLRATNIFTDGQLALATAALTADVNIKQLPTAIVDAVSGQGGKLEPMLGPVIDLAAKVRTTGGEASTGSATVTAKGEHLDANADLKLTDGLVTLNQPAVVKWRMTPAAFAKLVEPAPAEAAPGTPVGAAVSATPQKLQLTAPADVTARIESLRYPLGGENRTDWSKVAVTATVAAPSVALLDTATQKPAKISQLNAKIATQNLARSLKADVTAKVAGAANAEPGDLTVDATLAQLFNAEGAFNLVALSADVTAKATNIPGPLAEALLGSGSGKVNALIGERGSITITTKLQDMQGPVALTVDSQNTKASVDGRLADGYFLLNQDAHAQLMMTEELTDITVGGSIVDVLAGILFNNPLMKQAIKSIEPAQVTIAAEGFRVPTTDFAIERVQVAKATLAPGKLLVEKAGLISMLITLPTNVRGLNVPALIRDSAAKNSIEAWFAPTDITVTNGVVDIKRLDMLMGEHYRIAIWGKLNLSETPSSYQGATIPARHGRLVLGLTERAMRNIYGVHLWKGKPNYVDQFIMEGPIDTLGPNQTELVGRITALTAAGATGTGDVVGGVLQGVGGILKETGLQKKFDDPPPAPAAPWPTEEELKAQKEAAKQNGQQPTPTDPNAPASTDPNAPATPAPDQPAQATDQPPMKQDPGATDAPADGDAKPKKEKKKSTEEQLRDLGIDVLRGILENSGK